jgi:4-amino-4-deoxy-L-arabinose transferase-like glycosyltransferase
MSVLGVQALAFAAQWRKPKRAGLLVAAVAIGALAQYQLAQQKATIWQLGVYVLAGILFALLIPSDALPSKGLTRLTGAHGNETAPSALTPAQWNSVTGVVGLFVYCLVLFWNNHWREFSFYLWLALLLWYVVAFSIPLGGRRESRPRPRYDVPDALYWPLFVTIVLGVEVITLYRLEYLPFGVWYDEANFALYAQQILHGQVDWPFITPFSDPALQMYFHAISQHLFGSIATSTRMVAAVSGIVSVALLGKFTSTVWNRKFSLLAMVILGSMRWHLDFSRIGMNEMVFVCFELAVATTLALALTSRRPVWFAATGVFTGLTMHIYLPSAVVTGMVFITILCALIVRPRIQPALAGLLLLGFVLAYGPLLEAGIQNPSAYSGRAKQVSIFSNANTNPPLQALEHNVQAHLLMFNVQGDNNGRHNIPGQPQLDQVSALLFVLGLAWVIGHSRRLVYLSVVLWFLAMMLPGVFSLDFEAPQSARAVGAQVPVALFIAIAIYGATNVIYRATSTLKVPTWTRLAVPALAILLTAQIAVSNVRAYYDAQASNETVWEAYSTASTFTGHELARLPTHEPAFVSPDLMGTPSMLFLAPGRPPAMAFVPAETLPLNSRTPSVLFISRLDETYRILVHDYYPHAQVRDLVGPTSGSEPLVVEVRLSRRDLTSISGLVLSSSLKLSIHHRVIDQSGAFHGPGVPGDAIWRGGLHVDRYQNAALTFQAPGRIAVEIDGHQRCGGMRVATCRTMWTVGNHFVVVRVAHNRALDSSTLLSRWIGTGRPEFFTSPLMAHGLVASYYTNANWRGPAALARVEPTLSYYYQYLEGIRAPWSAVWAGQIHIPKTGRYVFELQSIDDSSVTIDGNPIVRSGHFVTRSASVDLTQGWHSFGARLRAITNGFRVFLSWIPPGGKGIVPVSVPTADFRP